MAINRYDVPLTPIQMGAPAQVPFDAIVTALGAKQNEYNKMYDLLGALEDKQFQNLDEDAEFASKARYEQQQLVDNLMTMNDGDLAANPAEIQSQVRKFARRYGPAGDIGGMQAAYNKFAKEYETIKESDLPSHLKQRAAEKLLFDYGNIMKGAKTDILGNTQYNSMGSMILPEFVDVQQKMLDLAKEYPVKKIAETTGWYRHGNQWYKNESLTEVVTKQELMEALYPIAMQDDKIADYLNFSATMNMFDMTDEELAEFNDTAAGNYQQGIQTRRANLLETKQLLNDPSQFKSNTEYQNFINHVLKRKEIKPDGSIGPKTNAARDKALSLVEQEMGKQLSAYQQLDRDGFRQKFIMDEISASVENAAEFYDQYNVLKNSWSMKFDPYALALFKHGLKDDEQEGPGDLVYTDRRNRKYEQILDPNYSPWEIKNGKFVADFTPEELDKREENAKSKVVRAGTMDIAYPFRKWFAGKFQRTKDYLFGEKEMEVEHPDFQNAWANVEANLQAQNVDTRGMTMEEKVEQVNAYNESIREGGTRSTFNLVKSKKEQDNFNAIFFNGLSGNVDDNGENAGKGVTGGAVSALEVFDSNGDPVPINELNDLTETVGRPDGIGINRDINSSMNWGGKVFNIGDDQYYMEPTLTEKMTAEWNLNQIFMSRHNVNATHYFESPIDGQTYRSSYHAATDTYDLQQVDAKGNLIEDSKTPPMTQSQWVKTYQIEE
jgi:hypothetical protein